MDNHRGLSAEALPVKLFICSWSSCLLYFPNISVTMACKGGKNSIVNYHYITRQLYSALYKKANFLRSSEIKTDLTNLAPILSMINTWNFIYSAVDRLRKIIAKTRQTGKQVRPVLPQINTSKTNLFLLYRNTYCFFQFWIYIFEHTTLPQQCFSNNTQGSSMFQICPS